MAEDADRDDKQHEPSQKRLEDARKQGDIARSTDLTAAVAYAGFFLVAVAGGGWMVERLASAGSLLLSQADRLAGQLDTAGSNLSRPALLWWLGQSLLPLLLVPALMVLASLVAQRAITVTPAKISPKLSRISPLANAKNKFGKAGIFEFLKSSVKLALVSAVLGHFLYVRRAEIGSAMTEEPGQIALQLGRLAIAFLGIVVPILGAIGILDLLWQRHELLSRNRMSLNDLREEAKESEGDPYMKQARRRRGQEIALNSMLADVPRASVVIVNPEHFAVALKWDRSFAGPPVCVAKGVDEIAARIREAANTAGVPIHRDPPTARAIFAATDIGKEIAPEHYGPVAAAIRFAEDMRARMRRRVTA